MTILCPHCHKAIASPPRLSHTHNQLFDFIFANPGCSKRQIDIGLYGRPLPDSRAVHTNIGNLARCLQNTAFRLLREGTLHSRTYSITLISCPESSTLIQESTVNGTKQLNPSLP